MLKFKNIVFPIIDYNEVRTSHLPMILMAVHRMPYSPTADGNPVNPLPPVVRNKYQYSSKNQAVLNSVDGKYRRMLFTVRNRGGNAISVILQEPTEDCRTFPEPPEYLPATNIRLCGCCGAEYIHIRNTSASFLNQLPTSFLRGLQPILVTNHLTKDDIRIIRGANRHARIFKVLDLYIIKYFSVFNTISMEEALGLKDVAPYMLGVADNREHLPKLAAFYKAKGVRCIVKKVTL